MEVNELPLAHPKLVGYQINDDYWIFAAKDFKPSYWLILKREGFSGDLFQASDELDEVTWELDDYEQLANIYRLEDTPPPDAWYKWDDFLRTDLEEFILAGRIHVYKVDEHVAQQLSDLNHPIYSNPDTSETAGTPSVILRNQLAETLGKDIMDRWVGKDTADRLHWDRSALKRELSEIGDIGLAVYDVSKDLVVGLKDIGSFVITAVKGAVSDAIELTLKVSIAHQDFIRKLANGEFDAIKQDLKNLGVMSEEAIKEAFKDAKAFAAKVEEGRKIFWNLTTDSKSRQLIYDYLDSTYQSIKYEDSRVIGVKIVAVIGIEVLLAMATAGAGNVARRVGQVAAKGAQVAKDAIKINRIGPFPAQAIDQIADLGRALDKPDVKTPEAPKMTIVPEGSGKSKAKPDGDAPKNNPKQKPDFDDIYKKAPLAKKEIDKIADDIAEDLGGTVAKAPIKSKERALEKITNDYGGDPTKIKDLARNTIIVPENKIGSAVQQLSDRGANVKVINGDTDPLGYSGVNSTIKTKAGIFGEIQVNTPEMIYAKEPESLARGLLGDNTYNTISSKTGIPGGQGHELYEQWRALDSNSSKAKAIAEKSKNYYNAIRGL